MMAGPFINYSYTIVDEENGKAVLIDPAWERNKIVEFLQINGLDLEAILLTHSHYDHVNLVNDLTYIYQCNVYISKIESEFFGYRSPNLNLLNDLDIITVGNIHILAILTPGHTVGSMCYLTNHTLFTGDTIFNEGCGMCFGQGADPKSMFQTIQRLKSEIPDSVMVYAGHCFSREVGELFGFLKQNNVYFLIENEKEFIDFRMRSGQKHLFSFN
jgi:probable polyketide biosynthesis zinc-dependent hydrolase baeB